MGKHLSVLSVEIRRGRQNPPWTRILSFAGIPLVLTFLNALPIRAQAAPAASAAPLSFEVASIKPNHSGDMHMAIMFRPGSFATTGARTRDLIGLAYDVKDFQVTGGPGWINSDRFDIEAKEPESLAQELERLPFRERKEKMSLLLQSLLADRFKLQVSHDTKDLPTYALVIAKNGPKLQEAKPGDTYPDGIKRPDGKPAGGPGMMRVMPGALNGQGLPMSSLAEILSRNLGRTVLDRTGLKGNYDLALKWAPDQVSGEMAMPPGGGPPPPDNAPPPDSSGPSLFTALQEQLGLKLESTRGPVPILVIDHIERPSEN